MRPRVSRTSYYAGPAGSARPCPPKAQMPCWPANWPPLGPGESKEALCAFLEIQIYAQPAGADGGGPDVACPRAPLAQFGFGQKEEISSASTLSRNGPGLLAKTDPLFWGVNPSEWQVTMSHMSEPAKPARRKSPKKPCSICHRWFLPDPRDQTTADMWQPRMPGQSSVCKRKLNGEPGIRTISLPAGFRLAKHNRHPSRNHSVCPLPLEKLHWDLAQDEFGVQGA